MRVHRLVSAVVVLLVVLLAGAIPAPAAEVRPAPGNGFDVLGRLGQLLASFWSEAGCEMDPWGRCLASPATGDEGCRLDPWGRCLTSPATGDEGCRLDPWGGCRSNP